MTAVVVSPMMEVLQKYLVAFNSGDWDTLRTTLTPDTVHIEPGGMELHGPAATVEGLKVFRTAFPDLHGDVTRLVMGERECAAELVWTGTHLGPFAAGGGPIPATGRSFSLPASKVFAFEGDLIKYSRHYWDLAELLAKIGAMPAPS